MDIVSLGKTGLKVSELCLGTMTFGSSEWKSWVLDEAEARPIIKRALNVGIIGSTVQYIGAVLLGPGVTYPLTTYSGSEGVFLFTGGSPEWKCGDEPRVLAEAGDIIGRPMGVQRASAPARSRCWPFTLGFTEMRNPAGVTFC